LGRSRRKDVGDRRQERKKTGNRIDNSGFWLLSSDFFVPASDF
jgi:hypothetical protein